MKYGLAVLLLLFAGMIGCGGSVPASNSTPAVSNPTEGAPMDLIKKATLTVFDANTVRATTLIETSDGNTQTLVIEFVKPDRIRIVQGDGGEQIAIKGQGIWRKNGDKWDQDGAEMADMLFGFLDPKAMEESLKIIGVDSIQFVGPELLNGQPTLVYTYKTTMEMGNTTVQGMGKIWIGALNGRALKGESTSDSIINQGKQDHTVVTYEYDIPITIQAPQ